jgi:hypothetical protein
MGMLSKKGKAGAVVGASFIWTLLALSLASAQNIIVRKCPAGTMLQCSSEAGPIVCQCVDNQTFPVTGIVTGLTASGLNLIFNDGQQNASSVGVFANGPITVDVPRGSYTIAVITEPTNQACVLNNFTGIAGGSSPPTPFTINCGAAFPVSVMISGLTGAGLEVSLETVPPYTVPQGIGPLADGTYPLGVIANNQSWTATVLDIHQPSDQICTFDGRPATPPTTISGAPPAPLSLSCVLGFLVSVYVEGTLPSNTQLSLNANLSTSFPAVTPQSITLTGGTGQSNVFPFRLPDSSMYNAVITGPSCTVPAPMGTIKSAPLILSVICPL